MVELAIRAGVERIILNGSFVTDIMEPNDVDCVLLFVPDRRRNRKAFKELKAGVPFLDIALAEQEEFDDFVSDVFATDRFEAPKGMRLINQFKESRVTKPISQHVNKSARPAPRLRILDNRLRDQRIAMPGSGAKTARRTGSSEATTLRLVPAKDARSAAPPPC